MKTNIVGAIGLILSFAAAYVGSTVISTGGLILAWLLLGAAVGCAVIMGFLKGS